ncbi:polysaccharide deacetylase family protein [Streptomyces sp. NPDC059909]|uniref:polysaccharide deacetylase family protein n=1 Tax=Streptomyces sp. NPDC059909 TaxID=3346998 RepID=UPI003657E976
MEKDQMPRSRRSVLRIAAACVGAATVAPLFSTEWTRTPNRPEAPVAAADPKAAGGPASAGGPQGAAGPQAAGPQASARVTNASAYRLQPMTAFGSNPLTRAVTPVRKEPFLNMPALGRSMVLTFDDGPDPRYTPDVLKILRKHDVRAMFFVCGGMAADHQDLLREIADDGHVVGNHTWSHPLVPKLSKSRIRDELGSTSEIVEKILGSPPLWYRAPYGAWNKRSFEIGAELGMEPLAWTIDTLDWREPGTGEIVSRVLDGAEPGAVVLSHDAGGDRSQSVAALRRYLPALLRSGYRITVPLR